MGTKPELSHLELQSWEILNDFIVGASETECERLLEVEKKGRGRKNFLLRIHSRLNRMRYARERRELLQFVK